MRQIVHLEVNGETHEVAIHLHQTLMQVLRDELGLLGTKQGCDTGGCGCCTVLLDGKAVYSCMILAATVPGKAITTIEGLADNAALDPIQQAFLDTGAVQCGYCTCGMILAAKAYLADCGTGPPDDRDIRQAIAGNLCRCTGYRKIVDAVTLAASRRNGATSAKG